MQHEKTNVITSILLVYRDQLLFQANDLSKQLKLITDEFKAVSHKMKLDIRELEKRAQTVQECITVDAQASLDEMKRMEQEYPEWSDLQKENNK